MMTRVRDSPTETLNSGSTIITLPTAIAMPATDMAIEFQNLYIEPIIIYF
jgi:hypothetical protein